MQLKLPITPTHNDFSTHQTLENNTLRTEPSEIHKPHQEQQSERTPRNLNSKRRITRRKQQSERNVEPFTHKNQEIEIDDALENSQEENPSPVPSNREFVRGNPQSKRQRSRKHSRRRIKTPSKRSKSPRSSRGRHRLNKLKHSK